MELRDYWRVVRAYWLGITALFLVAVLASIFRAWPTWSLWRAVTVVRV